MKTSVRVKLVFALALYMLFEGSAAVGLFVLKRARQIPSEPSYSFKLGPVDRAALEKLVKGETGYFQYDRELGWSIKPGGKGTKLGTEYSANAAGMRSSREYALQKPNGVVRIAAVGDSFTHGDDVNNNDTFGAQLEALRRNVELLNFGVTSYGTDQALLRFERDAVKYKPDIAILGFYPDDINRLLSAFRAFIFPEGSMPLAKPRFVFENDALKVLENPLQSLAEYGRLLEGNEAVFLKLGAADFYYQSAYHRRPSDALPSLKLAGIVSNIVSKRFSKKHSPVNKHGFVLGSEGMQILEGLFLRFAASARMAHAKPVIVFFPGNEDLEAYIANKHDIFSPLVAFLESKSISSINLLPDFAAASQKALVKTLIPDHYSPQGNRIVAERLLRLVE